MKRVRSLLFRVIFQMIWISVDFAGASIPKVSLLGLRIDRLDSSHKDRPHTFHFGTSVSIASSRLRYLRPMAFGVHVTKVFAVSQQWLVSSELGLLYVPKTLIDASPFREVYFQIGPKLFVSEDIYIGISWGIHVNKRHYFLTETVSEMLKDYSFQLGYRHRKNERNVFNTSIFVSRFLVHLNGYINFFGIKQQFYI